MNYNIYFVANLVAVVNPINWGRLRLRRWRAEEVPEGAPPRRKYGKKLIYYWKFRLTDILNF